MGAAVSSLVFRPPDFPTYIDDNGRLPFINPHDTTAPDYADLYWVATPHKTRIPVALFPKPDSPLTLIFSHDNAVDLGIVCGYARKLSDSLGVTVVAYDYTGYGLSTGDPSEKNCYGDILAVYKWVLGRGVKPEQVVLFGRSVGSGPSCELAKMVKVAGLVLVSAFTSAVKVAVRMRASIPGDVFDNAEKIRFIKCPKLILHARGDEIVPLRHGEELYRRCKPGTALAIWLDQGGHNDLEMVNWPLVQQMYTQFLKRIELSNKEAKVAKSTRAPPPQPDGFRGRLRKLHLLPDHGQGYSTRKRAPGPEYPEKCDCNHHYCSLCKNYRSVPMPPSIPEEREVMDTDATVLLRIGRGRSRSSPDTGLEFDDNTASSEGTQERSKSRLGFSRSMGRKRGHHEEVQHSRQSKKSKVVKSPRRRERRMAIEEGSRDRSSRLPSEVPEKYRSYASFGTNLKPTEALYDLTNACSQPPRLKSNDRNSVSSPDILQYAERHRELVRSSKLTSDQRSFTRHGRSRSTRHARSGSRPKPTRMESLLACMRRPNGAR